MELQSGLRPSFRSQQRDNPTPYGTSKPLLVNAYRTGRITGVPDKLPPSPPFTDFNVWFHGIVRISLAIREILFGKIYYRFSTALLTAGVFLIGGGGLIDKLVVIASEMLGYETAVIHQEKMGERSQWVGSVLIVVAICIFVYYFGRECSKPQREMAFSIIEAWSKQKGFSEEQSLWLSNHPKLAEKFWIIAKDNSINKRKRLRKLRTKWSKLI